MILIGIPIGFYGYLFPGNINIMVLDLYSSKRFKFLLFILGLIVVFESIYCILSLTLLDKIKNNNKFSTYIEIISYSLLFIMGLWMLLEKGTDKRKYQQNTILRGVLSIIIHPQQIPFWVIAGVLVNRVINVKLANWVLGEFILFNAIGSLLAMIFYMFFGNKILNYFRLNTSHINKIMGLGYILLVLYHLYPY